ncbi:MAG: hypothetical protein V1862_02605 [Methanobacteriota archaeon]
MTRSDNAGGIAEMSHQQKKEIRTNTETLNSVGQAAGFIVDEVRRQFKEIPGLMEGMTDSSYESFNDHLIIGHCRGSGRRDYFPRERIYVPSFCATHICPLRIAFHVGRLRSCHWYGVNLCRVRIVAAAILIATLIIVGILLMQKP